MVARSYPAWRWSTDHDAPTLSGLSIIVDGFNGINVGGVNVVQPDVMASNGIIQVVDGIIMPPA